MHNVNSQNGVAVTLRTVAEKVGLAPCSVSAVLNNTPASLAIPQRTKNRVLRAARQLSYRPNFSARSLRTKRTYTVALIAADLGHRSIGPIIAGVERFLTRKSYSLLIASYDGSTDWLENQGTQLLQRGVEGVLLIDSTACDSFALPKVVIDLSCWSIIGSISDSEGMKLKVTGESAAETVVGLIEDKSQRRKTITPVPKLVSAAFPAEGLTTMHTFNEIMEHLAD